MVGDILEIELSGSTVEETMDQALQRLGCSRAEVETTIVQTPSSGLFGLFGVRPARIRVRLSDRAFIARVITENLLRLSGFDSTVVVQTGSEWIDLKIRGHDSRLIIGRHGQTLDALQSLVTLLTDRQILDRTPIVLDVDNYRVRRASSLRRLARRLASQVRRTGRPASVQSLPPEERRILHLAFREEKEVETRSVGKGHERKIIVSLKRG
jgi:spoIIIJ-associated protein